MICVVCGKPFKAKRSDAECCGDNCRNKKSRERKKQMNRMRPYTWTIEQYLLLQQIADVSPIAANKIDQIRLIAGVEVALYAIDAIQHVADSMLLSGGGK